MPSTDASPVSTFQKTSSSGAYHIRTTAKSTTTSSDYMILLLRSLRLLNYLQQQRQQRQRYLLIRPWDSFLLLRPLLLPLLFPTLSPAVGQPLPMLTAKNTQTTILPDDASSKTAESVPENISETPKSQIVPSLDLQLQTPVFSSSQANQHIGDAIHVVLFPDLNIPSTATKICPI